MFLHGFSIFLPLVAYDCAGFKKKYFRFCWIAALPAGFIMYGARIAVAIVGISGIAYLFQYRTERQLKIQDEYFALTDSAKEHSMSLERRNKELMEKQDYEVHLATLTERNRISREIHDNVGHMLTRSILQLSALSVSLPGGDIVQNELHIIKNTMADAMDSIRNSVHDLYDESVDLEMQLDAMIGGFSFCPVRLRIDAAELPGAVKYCFLAVVREALSNIAKHSNATQALITVTDHPAFCRLSIEDNGTIKRKRDSGGIGLRNMADRVDALGGVFRAELKNGFCIFITVPKEKKEV
jgi:signal transduction histidine kinase